MAAPLFDPQARAARRERAFRQGAVRFVHQRAFDDIAERLGEIRRSFASALLIGTLDPDWPQRIAAVAGSVEAVEPGAGFAASAGARHAAETSLDYPPASFDLCVAAGTLDTIDDLPGLLARIAGWLRPDGLLIGVMPGGDTLPQLRSAMRAADIAAGAASPHVHPRIEAQALCHLLGAAGLAMPVVDVDRVKVGYPSLGRLVGDLRSMGATNVLASRSRFLGRAALAAAERHFTAAAGAGGRTVETFELLHFAAWAPDHG